MTTRILGDTQRLVLTFLVDQGPVDTDPGRAVLALAAEVGLGASHTANLVKRLDDLGLVETRHEGRFATHIGVTHEGRASVGREATWHRRQRRSRELAERAAVAPPAMPVAGGIGPLGPVNLEAAREAAAMAAVL